MRWTATTAAWSDSHHTVPRFYSVALPRRAIGNHRSVLLPRKTSLQCHSEPALKCRSRIPYERIYARPPFVGLYEETSLRSTLVEEVMNATHVTHRYTIFFIAISLKNCDSSLVSFWIKYFPQHGARETRNMYLFLQRTTSKLIDLYISIFYI